MGEELTQTGVIGLGALGTPLSLVFSKAGFKVYSVDVDEKKIIDMYVNRRFVEPKINEYLRKYGENLATSVVYDGLKDCEVVFIIVQTPSLKSGKLDIGHVRSALKELHKVNPDCLAVISSTLNIGDMEQLRKMHKRISYNPEFIARGKIIDDFENPKFVLIGAYNRSDALIVKGIWEKVTGKGSHIVRPVEAEIIKICSNVGFAHGITFANMIGEVCRKFNADSRKVLGVLCEDRRNYTPGLGFAGPCFYKDLKAFQALCEESNIRSGANYSAFVAVLNDYWVDFYYNKIIGERKKKIGITGLSYKMGVARIYESQSFKIAEMLVKAGFEVHIYDPLIEEAKKLIPKAISHENIEDLLGQVDLVFLGLPYNIDEKLLKNKIVINPWK